MNGPFPAYRGTEPYTFVCYAHKDSEIVFTDLMELNDSGIRIWYDEGIPAGTSWRAEIATAIKSARRLLFFISEASLASAHCLREVDYALTHDIEIVPVYLDSSALPGELELALNRVQALFRPTDDMYMPHLIGALQQSSPLAPLRPLTKKPKLRLALPVAVVVCAALGWLVWTQSQTVMSRGPETPGVTEPSAFDLYLEGLGLMERWDKDDNLNVAIDLFGQAANLDPDFALAFARAAEALRMRYVLTGNEEWLQEAARNADEAVRLNADLAPVQVALGRIHAARGNIDLATSALERALAIDANDPLANQAIAGIYERLGRVQDAEAAFKKAVALAPESPTNLDAYANFLFAQSRYGDAVRVWQTMTRVAPDHYAALVNLGTALSEVGRIAEAITMYERAIQIRPTYMAYSNLGTAYYRAERFADAVTAYHEALEIDDTDWLAWGNLAHVYSWIDGNEAESEQAFAKAIQLAEMARQQNPRDPFIPSDLGLYYANTGQQDLARERVQTAITLSPDSGEILAAAAEAHEILGDRDQAVELALRSLRFGYTRQHLQRNPGMTEMLLDPRMQE